MPRAFSSVPCWGFVDLLGMAVPTDGLVTGSARRWCHGHRSLPVAMRGQVDGGVERVGVCKRNMPYLWVLLGI